MPRSSNHVAQGILVEPRHTNEGSCLSEGEAEIFMKCYERRGNQLKQEGSARHLR